MLYIFGSFGGGGTEHHFVEMMRQRDLKSILPQVFIISRNDETSDALVHDGIPVHFVPKTPTLVPGILLLKSLFLLVKVMRQERFEVAHTFFFNGQFYGATLARLLGVKAVVANREDMGFAHNSLQLVLLRVTNRLVDKVVCIAQTVARACLESEGIQPEKVEVIHNGIAVSRADAVSTPRSQQDKSAVEIVCVANMNFRIKGHEFLLRAIRMVRERGVAVKLSLVGDGMLRSELQALSESLGIAGAVEFLGYIQGVDQRLAESDIFVLPSLTEGLSIAILEAARAGLPIIATNVGGNPEIVRHDYNGLLVPSSDSAAIADAIVRLTSDRDLCVRLSENARATVEQEFSIRSTLDSYTQLYRRFVVEDENGQISG